MATRMQQRRGTAAQWTGANPTLAAGEIGYETDTGKFKIGNGSSAWGALNYYVDANAILDGAPGVLDTLNELAAALGDDPAFITTVGTNLSNHTNATTSVHGIADTDDLATKDYVADAVSNAEVDQQLLAGTGIDWNSGTGQFDIDNTVATLDGVQTLTNKTLSSNTVATTQVLADSSTKIATTEFVQNRVASLIDNAPSALDTLNELAAALADDENFAATIATDIGDLQNNVNNKLSLSGGTLEGALTLQGDPVELLHAATKNYVDNASETAATGAVGAHNLLTTNIHGIDDVGELATKSYVGDELDTHALATDVHGISDAISTHANLSLNVHGIADTSLLATTANIETHRADTTNVHGITDTADLVLTGDARLSDTRTPTDDSVSTAKIVNSAVTSDKLAGDSVTSAKIADDAVTSGKIADGTIVNADINASAAIAQSKIDGLSDSFDLKANLASPTFTGTVVLPTVTAGGSIVPSTDNVYDLGSPTNMWKDIYVGPGSLYVNGQKVIQDESGNIVVSADANENLALRTSGSGNIELDPTGAGSVNIKGPLVVEAGANFSSNDGNGIAFSNGIKSNSIESNSLNTDLSLSGNGTGKVYLNDNAEVNGNLVVGGNLTVSGTTTTVNSETISLADNIIDLNSNFTTGTPTENSGLRVMRGDSNAVQVRWNESTDKWEFTNDGTNYSVIAPTDSPTFTGTVTIPSGASISGFAPLASPTFTGTVTVAADGIAFTDGTQTKEGVPSRTTINSISANYNLSTGGLTLRDTMVESTAGSGITVTIPTNATTAYPVGTTIDFLQTGAGQITFAAASGVTLNGTPGLKTRTQWSSASLFKRATDTWVVLGDLSA